MLRLIRVGNGNSLFRHRLLKMTSSPDIEPISFPLKWIGGQTDRSGFGFSVEAVEVKVAAEDVEPCSVSHERPQCARLAINASKALTGYVFSCHCGQLAKYRRFTHRKVSAAHLTPELRKRSTRSN